MFRKIWIGILLCVFLNLSSTHAVAQQGGHIGPSGGEIAGILVGAGAAIGVVVYLAIPKEKTIRGCVDPSDHGMRLTDDNDGRVYSIVADQVSLQPHRRVTLKGKKKKDTSGAMLFTVRKLLRDQGGC